MEFDLTTGEGKKAIWSSLTGINLQYVGMKGEQEVALQEGSKVLKLYTWPGGIPNSTLLFEDGIRKHLEGRGSLKLVYERK